MRVIEAAGAGVLVALVVAGMAWWVDADPVIPAGIGFLITFGGMLATGATYSFHGRGLRGLRRRSRHDFDLD